MIVAGGTKGHRYALPTSRFSIVPLERGSSIPSDEELASREMARMLQQLTAIVMERTGQPEAVVRTDFEQSREFDPGQAKEYGLIDMIAD